MQTSKTQSRVFKNARIIFLMLFTYTLAAEIASAGGGWIRQPQSLYAKVGVTMLSTNEFHASDGTTVSTADFNTQSVQLYGEYGVIENFSVVFDIPVFKRAKYVTTNAVTGFGDIAIEAKYGVLRGDFPVAVGLGFEFPTGDERAFARETTVPQAGVFLPTGDGEFNTWVRAYVSRSFNPAPAFASLEAGYNFRTEGLTNQYQIGLNGGYKFFDAVWLFGNIRRLATAGTANPSLIYNSIGVGEGVEYTTYGFGLSYEIAAPVSVSFDVASAFGTVKNIYSGANLGFGVAVEL